MQAVRGPSEPPCNCNDRSTTQEVSKRSRVDFGRVLTAQQFAMGSKSAEPLLATGRRLEGDSRAFDTTRDTAKQKSSEAILAQSQHPRSETRASALAEPSSPAAATQNVRGAELQGGGKRPSQNTRRKAR